MTLMKWQKTALWLLAPALLLTLALVNPALSLVRQQATGFEPGPQQRVSNAGPPGDAGYSAFDADVAYGSAQHEFFVVWAQGDDNGEVEIYGQRMDASTGAKVGSAMRISAMGPDGDSAYSAQRPAVVYNSTENEFLVVWQGDHNSGLLVDDEFEIYAQRVDGATGALIGTVVRVSEMGPDGDEAYDAFNPALAYNPDNNEYLVVWQGDDDAGGLADNENEIYAQRLSGSTGQRVAGTENVRISSLGPDGDASYRAQHPAVAYNSVDGEYLVVWSGDDDDAPLVAGELEILGQRLDAASGAALGDHIRISQMGAHGDTASAAIQPAVTYNPTANRYLVVWSGDEDSAPLVDGELEIFAQQLEGASGALSGSRLRISDAGPDGDAAYRALHPAVTYQMPGDRYLVTWRAEENIGDLVAGEFEIFGQWLDGASGSEVWENDFRISVMGSTDGSTAFQADRPAVASSSTDGSALVVWHGDHDDDGLVDGEYETYARRLELDIPATPTPTPTGTSPAQTPTPTGTPPAQTPSPIYLPLLQG